MIALSDSIEIVDTKRVIARNHKVGTIHLSAGAIVGEASTDPKVVIENIKKGYKLGYHKAAKMAEIATWANIWAVTGLDDAIIKSANMTPEKSVAEALKDALDANPDARVMVLADGSVTIPRPKEE